MLLCGYNQGNPLRDSFKGVMQFNRNLGGYQQANDSLGRLDHQVSAAYQFEFQDLMQARGLHGIALPFIHASIFFILFFHCSFTPKVSHLD
jgi:hypothetical protein